MSTSLEATSLSSEISPDTDLQYGRIGDWVEEFSPAPFTDLQYNSVSMVRSLCVALRHLREGTGLTLPTNNLHQSSGHPTVGGSVNRCSTRGHQTTHKLTATRYYPKTQLDCIQLLILFTIKMWRCRSVISSNNKEVNLIYTYKNCDDKLICTTIQGVIWTTKDVVKFDVVNLLYLHVCCNEL